MEHGGPGGSPNRKTGHHRRHSALPRRELYMYDMISTQKPHALACERTVAVIRVPCACLLSAERRLFEYENDDHETAQ